jgi:phosphate starvation-inducible PhoH-like protein
VQSGLLQAIRILKGVKGIGFIEFEKKDIVRHPLVQRIVDAYDAREKASIEEFEKNLLPHKDTEK